VINSTAPDRTNPAETTNTSATISVAGWPNPSKAFLLSTTPNTTAIINAEKATRS
jgi:hypothetical protein